jgi:hypothetical protein
MISGQHLLKLAGMDKRVGATPLPDDHIIAGEEYANQAWSSTLRGGGGVIGDKSWIDANMRWSGPSSGKRLYSGVSLGHIYTDLISGLLLVYQSYNRRVR